ncbi:MAG: nucleotidyltransferase family protein [Lachnospiraceae bacterium]|nr:nucleotidyltransferase family protein [Lachnospiraceae bacterium]
MKHIGLIAEYNPFHNGHQYQINKIKSLFPEKKLVIVMSGDYVQRGEPAIFNKYLRAHCALAAGADIILELPSRYAAASAEHFAFAGVLSLAAIGIIDTLCFGAESTDLSMFQNLASLFNDEPEDYRTQLKTHLKSGISYPKARGLSAAACLKNDSVETFLKQPNNILGIEYIRAIHACGLNLTPVIIERIGNGHHDLSTQADFCSASALRQEIQTFDSSKQSQPDLHRWIPPYADEILSSSPYAKPLFLSDFYPFLQYALWQESSYDKYDEVSSEISNRLSALTAYPADMHAMTEYLSGRNLTKTRIQRALLNILLKRSKRDMSKQREVAYLRLLGFRSTASPLLKSIQDNGEIPIINKVANARKILSVSANRQFEHDIQCSFLYRQAFYNKYGILMPTEYEHSVIII